LSPRFIKNRTEKIIAKPDETDATKNLSPAQEALRQLWETACAV
jgi:hypothetical protein